MGDEVALAEAASGQDPAEGLRATRALRELAERLERLQVANAREHGWSWQEIAVFLGVSKQAVHKKYASTLRGRPAQSISRSLTSRKPMGEGNA
jgi:predicted transcriptional regulator